MRIWLTLVITLMCCHAGACRRTALVPDRARIESDESLLAEIEAWCRNAVPQYTKPTWPARVVGPAFDECTGAAIAELKRRGNTSYDGDLFSVVVKYFRAGKWTHAGATLADAAEEPLIAELADRYGDSWRKECRYHDTRFVLDDIYRWAREHRSELPESELLDKELVNTESWLEVYKRRFKF